MKALAFCCGTSCFFMPRDASAGAVGVAGGEVHPGGVEAAALGDVAQDPLPGLEASRMEQLLEQYVEGCGAGVALLVEVGEPTFLGDIETRLEHVLVDLVAEIVRGIVRHEEVD